MGTEGSEPLGEEMVISRWFMVRKWTHWLRVTAIAQLWFCFFIPVIGSGLRLPSILGDQMVLQQNTVVNLWGWADPGSALKVVTGWDNKAYPVTADPEGQWIVKVGTGEAGGPYQIAFYSGDTIILSDIMLGEVWICSGQSNMEWRLMKTQSGPSEIPQADLPGLRLFNVTRNIARQPVDDVVGKWVTCTPESAGFFSAVGYYFGKQLNQNLEVPVGMILTSWGGTPSEAWTSRETVSSFGDFDTLLAKLYDVPVDGVRPPTQHSPTVLFNGMVHPIIKMTIKGVIWYQGEANVARAFQYRKIFPAMISDWRNQWDQGDFPFFFVQLAPYNYPRRGEYTGAELREAQLLTLTRVPNAGMAVTMDIGNPDDIHPRNKKDVGYRLALWALAKEYEQDLVYSGPLFKSISVEGSAIRVHFDHTGTGLESIDGPPAPFYISAADRVYQPARAKIEDHTIVVSHPDVKSPVAVSYGWSNAPQTNLFNREGLPASPFRSDDWPRITEGVK